MQRCANTYRLALLTDWLWVDQKNFSEAHDKDDAYFKAQRDIRRRIGLMTAFHLLQTVHNERPRTIRRRRSRGKKSGPMAEAASHIMVSKALQEPDVVSRELLQEFLEVCAS